MQVGIFAKTFPRPTLGETLDAIKAHGITHVQFNMSCAGRATLPATYEPELCATIAHEFARRALTMAAVSGTFNMAHPDPAVRRAGLAGLENLARSCPLLKTSVVTLCPGTRDPDDMWRAHPDNLTPAAWRDLSATIREALVRTEPQGVTLALEPEVSGVVDTAARARDLDEAAAEAATRRAEEAMRGKVDKMDIAEAQAELARAIAQLKAIGQLRKKR